MLSEKSTTTTARKATKPGCWNCTPQPTAAPATLASTAAPASSQKENSTPKVVASAPATKWERPWPALLTRPKILSESTGRTQGIRFEDGAAEDGEEQDPPQRHVRRNRARAGLGGVSWPAAAGAGWPGTTAAGWTGMSVGGWSAAGGVAAGGWAVGGAAAGAGAAAAAGAAATVAASSAAISLGGRHCLSSQAW